MPHHDHVEFQPRTAVREERRQANEALGRSFCKTISELVTNSDSSAKRKLDLPHSSGLVDLMLSVPKGTQLDTSMLRSKLAGKHPKRTIVIEVVTTKTSGRPKEVVVIDQAQGMSADNLKTALMDIAGDRTDLSSGIAGRNLFGRGLSDVMRAHSEPIVQTCDGKQLTIVHGEWPKGGRWTIKMDSWDEPQKKHFEKTFLQPASTGTAVRFIIGESSKCRIPKDPDIISRIGNFYMLRLIAADPNVELLLKQHRAKGFASESIVYDFPVGQVVDSFSRIFSPGKKFLSSNPITIDFLLLRSDCELKGLSYDRDARENGFLVVDELDAVYDLTFADPDYEKADFLKRFFGVVRINGLRGVLESYLNSPDFPSSPLRVDRDGFNLDHEFSKALLEFIANALKPYYEKERKLAEQKEEGQLSVETRKRIDDALKQLNEYFLKITGMTGGGTGVIPPPKEPESAVLFLPQKTRLIAGVPRQVFLLIRDDSVSDGCELIATASDGISVQTEIEKIYKKKSPRWSIYPNFFCFRLTVSCSIIGHSGNVTALVEGANGQFLPEAELKVEDVFTEKEIVPPENMEFRPSVSMGRPSRRNNLVLFINPKIISAGHYMRFSIVRRTGDVCLLDNSGGKCDQMDIKITASDHQVEGQQVFRVLVPWMGTAWNQHASVEARVKIGGPTPITTTANIRLEEPRIHDGGFFKDVRYDAIDPEAPSQFAAGVIIINNKDPLNQLVFGETQEEYDRRISRDQIAQQRLVSLLLEEASFRALQQRFDDNDVHFPDRREIAEVHQHLDRYKFESAIDVFKALVK